MRRPLRRDGARRGERHHPGARTASASRTRSCTRPPRLLVLLQADRERRIRTIYYGEFYREARSIEVARQLGIRLVDLSERSARVDRSTS